jgi:hypothetical protein
LDYRARHELEVRTHIAAERIEDTRAAGDGDARWMIHTTTGERLPARTVVVATSRRHGDVAFPVRYFASSPSSIRAYHHQERTFLVTLEATGRGSTDGLTETRRAEALAVDDKADEILQVLANRFGIAFRSPLLHDPGECGLEFENVSFASQDGVPLEGWLMPARGSDKIIIANHPLWFSRAGLPAHLEPWRSIGAAAGNDFEINLVPDYKILHDAGYNVLTYDHRNFGHSGAANGGIISSGVYEARDVIGSLDFVRRRPDLSQMSIGLFSRCLGCNATMFAMRDNPKAFRGVRCMVGVQPISMRVTLERVLALLGLPTELIDELEQRMRLHTSFLIDDLSPVPAARSVTLPTFLYQVRDDLLTLPRDVQAIFDNIPVEDKKLHWIEGSTRRLDGYGHFAKSPEQSLSWFDSHMY